MNHLKPYKIMLYGINVFSSDIDLYVLIAAVTAQFFNPITELVIPIGIPTKKAKKILNHIQ